MVVVVFIPTFDAIRSESRFFLMGWLGQDPVGGRGGVLGVGGQAILVLNFFHCPNQAPASRSLS